MDITYIPMARGFVYLTAIVDWFSRRVLAWRLSITMEVGFYIEALEEALARHGRPDIFNTEWWLGLSEQRFGFDKWNVCRVQAAAMCGKPVK